MKKYLFIIPMVLMSLVSSSLMAETCYSDSLKARSSDGRSILLGSMYLLNVNPGDNLWASMWLPQSQLTLCEKPGFQFRGHQVRMFEITNQLFDQKASASLKPYDRCVDEMLKKNIGNGKFLMLQNGSVLEVMLGDDFDAQLWMAGDNLAICGPEVFEGGKNVYGVFDVTQNGKVSVTQ